MAVAERISEHSPGGGGTELPGTAVHVLFLLIAHGMAREHESRRLGLRWSHSGCPELPSFAICVHFGS